MALIETTETPEDIERLLEKARTELQAFEDAVDGERLLARVKRASPAHPVLLARAAFLLSGTLFLLFMIAVLGAGLFHTPSALFLSGLQEKMGIPGGLPAVCILLSLCMFIAYIMATFAARSIGRETPMLQWEAKEYQKLVNEVTRLTTQKAVMERIRGTPGGARPRIATPVPMSMRGRGPGGGGAPSAGGFGGAFGGGGDDSAFGGASRGGSGFGGGGGGESVPPYLQSGGGNAPAPAAQSGGGFGGGNGAFGGGNGAFGGGGSGFGSDNGGGGGGFGGDRAPSFGGGFGSPQPSSDSGSSGGFGGGGSGFGGDSAPDDGYGVGLPPTGNSLLSRARSGGSPPKESPSFGGNDGFGGGNSGFGGGGSASPSFGGASSGSAFGGGSSDSGFGGGSGSPSFGGGSSFGGNDSPSPAFGGDSPSFGGSSSGFGAKPAFGETPSYVEFAEEAPTETHPPAYLDDDEEVGFALEEDSAPAFGGSTGGPSFGGFGSGSTPAASSGFGSSSSSFGSAPLGDASDNTAGIRIGMGSPTRGGTPLGAKPRAGIALGNPRLAAPMGFPGTPEPSTSRDSIEEYDAEIMEDLSYGAPEEDTAPPRVGIQMARVRQSVVPTPADPAMDIGDIVETLAPNALVEGRIDEEEDSRENGLPRWGRIDEMWLEEAIEKAENMVRSFPPQARLEFSIEEHLPFTLVIERATPAMAVRAMVGYVEFLASIYTPQKARIELRKVAHLDRSFHRNVDAALQPYFAGKVEVENNGGQVEITFQDPDPGWDAYPMLPMQ